MKVREILDAKGRGVVTIRPDATGTLGNPAKDKPMVARLENPPPNARRDTATAASVPRARCTLASRVPRADGWEV